MTLYEAAGVSKIDISALYNMWTLPCKFNALTTRLPSHHSYSSCDVSISLVVPKQAGERRKLNSFVHVHCVSKKNVPPLACYNFDAHEWIWYFGRNVTNKVGNQKTLYYATSNNLCFCTTWQNVETWKSHISLNWIVLHAQCTCELSSWKK